MSPPLDLTPVDKLEVLILVDNFVEWFSTLPPEFTHELPQHLASPDVPKDSLTGLPIMDFDNYCCGAHGLSILIKTTIGENTYSVLLDSGPEPKTIERNVAAMSVDLTQLDAVVLSHWHRDHSGGIVRVLELRQAQLAQQERQERQGQAKIKIDLHPSRPIRRGIARRPNPEPFCNLPADPSFDEIKAAGGEIDLHDEPHEIVVCSTSGGGGEKTGVGVSGEIKRVVDYEKGVLGGVRWEKDESTGEEGWFTDTMIMDERYVVVDVKGKGLVVFSSCSHAGISNVITSLLPLSRPIHALIAGLHLVPTSHQPARETIDFITARVQPRPRWVVPLHCTGLEARGWLRERLGEGCVLGGVGVRGVFGGGRGGEGEGQGEGFKIVD
ncbi:metallo-beta-lactamase superfamily protein [Cryptococcus neoformans Bt1]|nr:metallo-beta-lactamase superfamily protein [Cryptococcus neoformans var. grubii Bt1]